MSGFALLVFLSGGPARAETIFLKNGRKVEGVVEFDNSDDQRIVVRTARGTIPIPRSNIDRIEGDGGGDPTVSAADKAIADGNLDAALALLLNKFRDNSEDEALRGRIEELRGQIAERDNKLYGAAFDAIARMLADFKFQEAIDEAMRQRTRAKEPSVTKRFGQLIAAGHLGLARRFEDRVDYPKAEEQFRAAIMADPDAPLICFELADMLQLSPARKVEAIPLYLQGIELAGHAPGLIDEKTLLDYEFKVAQLFMANQEYVLAAENFLAVAGKDTNRDYPQAFDRALDAYSRIPSLADVADQDRIIANLRSILRMHPDNQRAALLLGRIFFERDDWQSARNVLSDAVQASALIGSNVAMQEALYFLGISHRRLGDSEQAAQCFQALVNQRVATYDTYCELGDIRLEQGSYKPAFDLYNQARSQDRDKYRAYLGLGEALRMLERYPEARENYREVVIRDENNVRAMLAIGKTFYMEESMQEAIDATQKAIAGIRTGDTRNTEEQNRNLLAEAYVLIGHANMQLNFVKSAREEFSNALRQLPEYASALDGLGQTFQSEGFHQKAQDYFQRAIDADPRNPDYRLSLAINFHKYQKNTTKALPNYYAYLELGGKDPSVRRWIADCGGTPPAEVN